MKKKTMIIIAAILSCGILFVSAFSAGQLLGNPSSHTLTVGNPANIEIIGADTIVPGEVVTLSVTANLNGCTDCEIRIMSLSSDDETVTKEQLELFTFASNVGGHTEETASYYSIASYTATQPFITWENLKDRDGKEIKVFVKLDTAGQALAGKSFTLTLQLMPKNVQ